MKLRLALKYLFKKVLLKGLQFQSDCGIIAFAAKENGIKTKYRGVEQLVARRAHNPKVVGSSPSPATMASVLNQPESWMGTLAFFVFLRLFVCMSRNCPALFLLCRSCV